MKTVVAALGALASEQRLMLMELLLTGPRAECDLAAALNASRHDVRGHLAILTASGCIVADRPTPCGCTLYRPVTVEEASEDVYDVLSAVQTLVSAFGYNWQNQTSKSDCARGDRGS